MKCCHLCLTPYLLVCKVHTDQYVSHMTSLSPNLLTVHASKTRLLEAALKAIRQKGYVATTVDDLCALAGVTKGSFFHHFKDKQELVLASIQYWSQVTGTLFRQATYQQIADARERVLAYVDFRAELIQGEPAEFSCLLGTLVQDTFDTHLPIREACDAGMRQHADEVARDIALAKAECAPDASWSPDSLALYTQAVIQGAFILAKAQGQSAVAKDCIAHLRSYVAQLLPAVSNPTRKLSCQRLKESIP